MARKRGLRSRIKIRVNLCYRISSSRDFASCIRARTFARSSSVSVAVARLNDNVHYTSDVFAGAVIGTAIGRSIVARHQRAAAAPRVAWTMVPMQRGLALEVAVAPETLIRFVRRR